MKTKSNNTSELALKLARSHLATARAQREFAERVNPRYVFSVMSVSHRLYADSNQDIPFNRNSLVLDLVPWNMSQATAYRLIEDFAKAGFISENADGRIEATEAFIKEYEMLVINALVLRQTFGSDSYQGQVHAPDFWVLRDADRKIISSGGLLEALGYQEGEKLGSLPGELTNHAIMEPALGEPINPEVLRYYYESLWSSDPHQITDFPWAMLHKDGSTVYTLMTIRATMLDGTMNAFTFCRMIPETTWRSRIQDLREKTIAAGRECNFAGFLVTSAEHD